MNLLIRRILAVFGLLLILTTIAGGVSIVIFSHKFIIGNINMTLLQYIFAMIGYGIAQLLVGILGLILIYVSVDYKSNK